MQVSSVSQYTAPVMPVSPPPPVKTTVDNDGDNDNGAPEARPAPGTGQIVDVRA